MNKQEWSTELRAFSENQARRCSIPGRNELSVEEEWQCRIIGGEFISWYQHHLDSILQQRMALRVIGFDSDPMIVFTTSVPGLVAAREILQSPPENLVYLRHSDFEEWTEEHPVDSFTFHIHHWSYFQSASQELSNWASEKYPQIATEEFRIHTSGDLWGERCGVEGHHLWRWDGQSMELVEEAFSHIRY